MAQPATLPRLFAGAPCRPQRPPSFEALPTAPPPSQSRPQPAPASAPAPSAPSQPITPAAEGPHHAALLAVLSSPAQGGEPAAASFARKERELIAIIDTLTVAECRALGARLRGGGTGDVLAVQFGRLVADRRERILAFIADARRREATRPLTAGGRRG